MSFLYSSSVSNSLMSLAKSSSSAGSSVAVMPFTFTWNTAALPASSLAWYASGKVTSRSFSSPMFMPTICSSKPGMKVWEPILRVWPSAVPPAKATPSTVPA